MQHVKYIQASPQSPEITALRQLLASMTEAQQRSGLYGPKALTGLVTTAVAHILAASSLTESEIDQLGHQIRRGLPDLVAEIRRTGGSAFVEVKTISPEGSA